MQKSEKEELIKELKALRHEIYTGRKFAVYKEEQEERANEIKELLVSNAMADLNNAFIESQSWQEEYYCRAEPWNLIICNGTVCFVRGVYTTTYNEGLDTFEYRLNLKGVFENKEFEFDCGYYDRTLFLIQE